MSETTDSVPFADPIVREARARFDRVAEWEAAFRPRFINDIKFRNGDSDNGYQWKESIRRNRDVDNRPCLTMNMVRQHNLQISNELRQNKSEIKVLATGNDATAEAALVWADLIRYVQMVSNAQDIFTIARNFQIDGGRGWWRIVTQYVSPDSFDQDPHIMPVMDPLSVYMDPDIQQKDGSDAEWAFVFDDVPIDQWSEAYPHYAELGRQPMGVGAGDDDWVSRDHIRVCEYFRKVYTQDTLISFVHLGERKAIFKSNVPGNAVKALLDAPSTRTRPVSRPKIEWHLIVGDQVVDSTDWLGQYIPLIRCVGEELVIDGVYDCWGHTRNLKDAQRMYNWNAALAVDTPIPTPNGWTKMGDLKAGDLVFTPDGLVAPVKAALPIRYDEECFKITFSNGHSVVTDAGHIWRVEERGKRKSATFDWQDKTVTTAELVKNKHFIKTASPLELAHSNLSVDPYVLGCWLGDGHVGSGRISAHINDADEQKELFREVGFECGDSTAENGLGVAFTILDLRGKLEEIGVLSHKHIPKEYLRASRQQRMDLLQGLMDTDGHFAPGNNQAVFVNTNRELVKGVLELCASLGINASVKGVAAYAKLFPNGKEYISQSALRVTFTPDPELPIFRLYRKVSAQTAARLTHWRRTHRIGIVSVVKVESVPVRCIELDTPDHLYLCGHGMIPTHNSAQVEFVSLQGKTPWLAPAKAIEELESMWNTANVANHSVLIYNHIDDTNPETVIPPPQRIDPPNFSAAYQTAMETAFNQMMMTSGQWQNQMGQMGNERTGAAIGKRQQQGDTATYHYQDNYEIALRYTGTQLIDLIPHLWDTTRAMMIMSEKGEITQLVVDPMAQQALQKKIASDGRILGQVFNPNVGRYAIAPGVGPAYGSKREEAVEKMGLLLAEAPALVPIIGDLMIGEMDFDGAREAAQRMFRMVPPEALGNGPTANEKALGAKNAGLTNALAEALNSNAKAELKLIGKDQMRDIDATEANTKRLAALKDFLPIAPEALNALIRQAITEAMSDPLSPIFAANSNNLDIDDVGTPPAPGARQGADKSWYMPHPDQAGKWMRVERHKSNG